MVLSALFIMDPKGKVLISRNYRGDIPMSVSEKFALTIQEREESELRPVFTEDGITYIYIKSNNLIIMAVTKRNSNVNQMKAPTCMKRGLEQSMDLNRAWT